MTTSSIVLKVWNYCNILRDDGVSYGDYLEQLTYLLFLKMAYEYSKPPHNRHFTLKTQQMKYDDLNDFVQCYNPKNRFKRKETDCFKKFTYDEIISRDKTNLDIFWLKDDSLGDMENLPDPDVLANEIVENLESGLESFKEIIDSLNGKKE